MTTVKEIEDAVASLSPDDLSRFSAWFADFAAAVWDEQIAADARNGKLDALADDAITSLRNGQCTEL